MLIFFGQLFTSIFHYYNATKVDINFTKKHNLLSLKDQFIAGQTQNPKWGMYGNPGGVN
jgi:hypothetical protein